MAMVVRNNMSAVNTLNTLNRNSSEMAKSLQKVSSGMQINSAADDSSAYAISERMRVYISGIDQDDKNAQNGSSLLKVAEGAVSSTVEILKTLKQKVINAANDTNTDADRATIQKELDQSIDQIDDNANVSFNGKLLVDGSKNGKSDGTYTALTNQSLSTDTTAASLLTKLRSRSGDSLNIVEGDTVTVSYVQNGKTFTSNFTVEASSSLASIMLAAENADDKSQTFAPSDPSQVSSLEQAYQEADSKWNAVSAAARDLSNSYNAISDNKASIAAVAQASSSQALSAIEGFLSNKYSQLTSNIGSAGYFISLCDTLTGTHYYSDYDSAMNSMENAMGGYADVYSESDIAAVKTARDQAKAAYEAVSAPQILNTSYIGIGYSGASVYTANGDNALTITSFKSGVDNQIAGFTVSVSDKQGNIKKSANAVLDAWDESIRAQNKSEDNSLVLQTGTRPSQAIKVQLTDMRSVALGLKGSDGTTLNISTQKNANAAINVLDNALQKALDQQTTIGAMGARLGYTTANLETAGENVQASESAIRDADMAREMTDYTKNKVLLQSSQAMLAQANQQSSGILTLLT